MNRSAKRPLARLAATSALLMLAACGSREEAEPAPSPSEGPRSIFEQDAAKPGADGDAVTLPPLETTLGFPDGTAELSEAARAELVTVLRSPQMGRGGRIVLRGHSDSDGSDEANLSSSLERADAVRDFDQCAIAYAFAEGHIDRVHPSKRYQHCVDRARARTCRPRFSPLGGGSTQFSNVGQAGQRILRLHFYNIGHTSHPPLVATQFTFC